MLGPPPTDRRLRAFLLNPAPASPPTWSSRSPGQRDQRAHARPAARRPAADHRLRLPPGRGDRRGRPGLAGGHGPARADRHEQDPDLPDHRRARSDHAEDDRRRMVRVLAFLQAREHDLAWAHPVDGVTAYVDLIEKKVLQVTDEFELPVPAESGDYDDPAVRGPQRTSAAPDRDHPAGGAELHPGRQPAALAGLVAAGRLRPARGAHPAPDQLDRRGPVIYRASIPEMVVPYGDPRFRYWQAYFDTGEYLVGKWANSLELGCDCLGEITYLDAVRHRRHRRAPDHRERDLHPRGGLRHPLEAHRHLQRLGPVAAPAPAGGVVTSPPSATTTTASTGTSTWTARSSARSRRPGWCSPRPTRRRPPATPPRSRPGSARRCTSTCSAPGWTCRWTGWPTRSRRSTSPACRSGPDNPYGNAIVQQVTRLTRESQAAAGRTAPTGGPGGSSAPNAPNRFGRPTGYTLLPGVRAGPARRPRLPAGRAGRASPPTTCGSPGTTRTQRYPAGDFVNQNPGGAGLPAFIAARPGHRRRKTSSSGTRSGPRTSRARRTGR